jgi:hypothetical protein
MADIDYGSPEDYNANADGTNIDANYSDQYEYQDRTEGGDIDYGSPEDYNANADGMSFFDTSPGLFDSIKSFFVKPGGGYDYGKMAALGTGLASISGLNKANKAPVGFQGTIPNYTAVRQQVQMPNDPNRRPGQAGRRYFSDVQYAAPADVAAKQAIAQQQATSLTPALMSAPAAREVQNGIAASSAPQTQKPSLNFDQYGLTAPIPSKAYLEANQKTIPNIPDDELRATDPNTPIPVKYQDPNVAKQMAAGGIATLASGKYLRGHTDGMADKLPAQIGKDQPAKLSHGEFVIPADVVSHLGNGNSDAGANVLYSMMAKVRKARTGTDKQGKKINPENFTPGGGIKAFAAGGSTGVTGAGSAASAGVAGTESNLSNWAGPAVTDMIGRGQALSKTPYEAYTGPLTAGASDLQTQAFGNASNLNVPTDKMGGYTVGTFDATQADKYMNPFLSAALNPVLEEQRRQAGIDRVANAGRFTAQGAYGGGRQAIMESEGLRNLGTLQNKTLTEGYRTAYDKAMDQFNKEQGLGLQAQQETNKYGLSAIEEQAKLGGTQRGIESEGIAADKAQFEEERADPFKKLQFQQSLFQGMPVQAQSYTPAQTSALQDLVSTGSMSAAVYKQLQDLGIIPKTPATTPTVPG